MMQKHDVFRSDEGRRSWIRSLRRLGVALGAVGILLGAGAGVASAAGTPFSGTAGYFNGSNTVNLANATGTDLTWNGTAAFASTNFPGASYAKSYSLDGNTTLTDADTSVGNLGSGDFAVGVHFETTQSASRIILLSKQTDCSGQGSWLQVALANNGVYVQAVGPTSSDEFTGLVPAGTTPEDGSWHYVELVRSGDTLYLLIDGQEVASAPTAVPTQPTRPPLPRCLTEK